MLLGMLLGLSLAAVAGPPMFGPTADRASVCDAAAGEDQTDHPDVPRQPLRRSFIPELQDTELQKKDGGDDDPAVAVELATLASDSLELCVGNGRWLDFVERRSEAAQRVREGHGARGPPSA